MDLQLTKDKLLATRESMGPWWQMPLVFAFWLIPAAIWGEYYLGQGLNQIISLMLLPFALRIRQKGVRSYRFLIWSLVFAGLAFPLGNNLLVFLALAFGLLFFIEFHWGKVGYLPALLFILMTPFLSSWLTAFTFPLQLGQSSQVGAILYNMGFAVEVHGNRFLVNDSWFSVDAACLGIHILSMGFFISVLVLALFEQEEPWPWWEIILWLVFAALLSYAANFVRMLILVLFQSPPDTVGHELTGLFSLAIFVGLPVYVAVWLREKLRKGTSLEKTAEAIVQKNWQRFIPHVWAICLALLVVWKFWAMGVPSRERLVGIQLPGYESSIVRSGIAQLSRKNSLIYVKAPTSPWRADHHPSICWEGTGFTVQQIHLDTINGKEVFKALLVSPPDTLYTSWWYDNGRATTSSQFEWRKRAILGEDDFFLINVSQADPDSLDDAIGKMLDTSIQGLGLVE